MRRKSFALQVLGIDIVVLTWAFHPSRIFPIRQETKQRKLFVFNNRWNSSYTVMPPLGQKRSLRALSLEYDKAYGDKVSLYSCPVLLFFRYLLWEESQWTPTINCYDYFCVIFSEISRKGSMCRVISTLPFHSLSLGKSLVHWEAVAEEPNHIHSLKPLGDTYLTLRCSNMDRWIRNHWINQCGFII